MMMDGANAFWIIDENGKPKNVSRKEEWSEMSSDPFNRIVARERVGRLIISTVLLATNLVLDNGLCPLFETMVFNMPDADKICKRYATIEEAIKGHHKIVAELKAKTAGRGMNEHLPFGTIRKERSPGTDQES